MTTTATAPDYSETIAKLQAHLVSLGDSRDCRSDNEKAAWWSTYKETQRCITSLMNAGALDKPTRLLAECEERRAVVLAKQAELEKAIADAPDWRSFADGRDRDREYDRQRHLRRQLELLHTGKLLMAPEVFFDLVVDLDVRIKALQERIAALHARLDADLRQAEALLAASTPTS